MKKRFIEEQIIGFLGEAEAGLLIKELCRQHGFSEATYYLWRFIIGGLSVPDVKKLKCRVEERWCGAARPYAPVLVKIRSVCYR